MDPRRWTARGPDGRNRAAGAARHASPILFTLALSPLVAASAPAIERPVARMRRLIEIERAMGLFFEPTVYGWCAPRPRLMRALEATYLGTHLPVALGTLAWVGRAHPGSFAFARDAFVATQTLAVIGNALAPTAPPRMVAGLGYNCRPGPGDHGLGRLAQSPYAAMPSAHTAFAVVAGGTVLMLTSSPSVRVAALLYSPAVVLEIIATGNHIWLDAAGGLFVAGLGFATAHALRRRRRSASRASPVDVAATPRDWDRSEDHHASVELAIHTSDAATSSTATSRRATTEV